MKKIYTLLLAVGFVAATGFAQQAAHPSSKMVQKSSATAKQTGPVSSSNVADFTPTIWDDNAGKPGTVLGTGTAFTVAQVDTSVAALKQIGSPIEAIYNTVGVFSSAVTIPANHIFWAGFTMNYASGDSAGLVTSKDATPGDAPGTTGDFPQAQNYTFEQWSDNSWNSFNDGTTNTWGLDIANAIFPAVTLTSGADTLTVHLNISTGVTPTIYKSGGGGYVSGQNNYSDIAKVQKFDSTMGVTSGGTINSILFWFGAKIGGGAAVNNLSSNLLSVSATPNPAFDVTTIRYELNESENVSLSIVDLSGKEVFSQAQGTKAQGKHQVKVDVSNFNSGMYFYTLTAGNYKMTGKMSVVK
ncbi:MAG: T9SS type A sorting domain-containing protein [Bacteroidetes bacterium]|nr:T9SS type A sorting domain-containing protein [Bacteroidota bacterium]